MLIREAFPQGKEEVAKDLGVDTFVKAKVALTITDKSPTRLVDAVIMAHK